MMHGTCGHLEASAHNVGRLVERLHVAAYDIPGQGLTAHAEVDLEIDHLTSLLDLLRVSSERT